MTTIVIIGCGPAGLAVAARLRREEVPFKILEGSDEVGHSWRNHYDRLHLHTVKQYSHLPFEPFPDSYPTYVSRKQLVSYLDDYADKYDVRPQKNAFVKRISRAETGFEICLKGRPSLPASRIVVATGTNRIPRFPGWAEEASFSGEVLHSKYYKNAKPYSGQRVLVVGMGNTGAELALDLAEAGVHVSISVRSPISVVPRDLNGRPVQVTSKQLARLPFGIGDWLGNQIRKVYFGNLEKYGLRAAALPPAVQLRKTGKTPVIDIGTIAAIKEGRISVRPDVSGVSNEQVNFIDNTSESYDAIILATGYEAGLDTLLPGIDLALDENGLPSSPIGKNEADGIYFVGYDNYKLGGILGTIHSDSALIVNDIKEKTAFYEQTNDIK